MDSWTCIFEAYSGGPELPWSYSDPYWPNSHLYHKTPLSWSWTHQVAGSDREFQLGPHHYYLTTSLREQDQQRPRRLLFGLAQPSDSISTVDDAPCRKIGIAVVVACVPDHLDLGHDFAVKNKYCNSINQNKGVVPSIREKDQSNINITRTRNPQGKKRRR